MGRYRSLRERLIARSAVRRDLLGFGVPGTLVLVGALRVTYLKGDTAIWATLRDLAGQPQHVFSLGLPRALGLFLFVFGLATAAVAAVTLGRSYASTPLIWRGHRLRTHGVYRAVRHPLYLGVLAACLGVPLCSSSFAGLLIMALLIPLFLYRIKIEEGLLAEEFGEEYRRYRDRTKKLIPFVY